MPLSPRGAGSRLITPFRTKSKVFQTGRNSCDPMRGSLRPLNPGRLGPRRDRERLRENAIRLRKLFENGIMMAIGHLDYFSRKVVCAPRPVLPTEIARKWPFRPYFCRRQQAICPTAGA